MRMRSYRFCVLATSSAAVVSGGAVMTSSHRQQCWITPSLLPPLPSALHFHHPDFYTVLQNILPLTQHRVVDSNPDLCGDARIIITGNLDCTHPDPPLQNRGISLSSSSSLPSLLPLLCSNENKRKNLCMYDNSTQSGNCASGGEQLDMAINGSTQQSQGSHYTARPSTMTPQMSDREQRKSGTLFHSTPSMAGLQQRKVPSIHSSEFNPQKTTGCELAQSRLQTMPNGSIQLSTGYTQATLKKVNSCKEHQSHSPTDSGKEKRQLNLTDVRDMTQGELDCTETLLHSIEECGMTLVFSDRTSQLRERKTKSTKQVIEIDGVGVAVPTREEQSNLKFYFFPLDPRNHSLDEWCKHQLLSMLHHTRVICYGAQEIVTTLINHYTLHSHTDVWLEWQPLDVKIGTWLLDPDNVPDNFHQMLSRFNMPPGPTQQTCFDATICQDLALLGPLMVNIFNRLEEHNLWVLFSEVETSLVPILGSMEAIGIQVDTDKLLHFADLLKLRISHVEACAHKVAKRPFAISSTLQLRQVLFDELQLDKLCAKKLSKTHILKHKSTSEAVLHQLQDLHPLPGLVLEYRQLCKMNATYISGLLPFISEGVLHPCWQHTGAATGRLVSCSPNIQAFPKQAIQLGAVKKQFVVGKEEENHSVEVREAIVSRDGYSFVATDFRSIELRLLAHLSGDPALISILTTQPQDTSSDVFTSLAAQWLNVGVEKVTSGDRERAKRVVYAIVYGVGKEKLAEILGMNASAAKELMTSFLNRFSRVQAFLQETVTETRCKGYAETICHRKRWFPHITSGNPHLKSYSERQAINFPIQGSAADICKCGMVQVVKMLARESSHTRLLLQIHDELLFEVPDHDIQLVSEKVKAVLESSDLIPSCKLKVPLEVRITVGKNWAAISH